MSSSSSTTPPFSPVLDHLPLSEQLCYVHCKICDTILAVSVPCSSFFKTVTVRCGHCTNLLPLNMRAQLFPSTDPQFHQLNHPSFSPSLNLLEEIQNPPHNFLISQTGANHYTTPPRLTDELSRAPVVNRPPEKRQRVPSAYNRFIKDEIQRIKSVNPDISHREAFSAAAKNWAHFPHIHFGLIPDQTLKTKTITRQLFFVTRIIKPYVKMNPEKCESFCSNLRNNKLKTRLYPNSTTLISEEYSPE